MPSVLHRAALGGVLLFTACGGVEPQRDPGQPTGQTGQKQPDQLQTGEPQAGQPQTARKQADQQLAGRQDGPAREESTAATDPRDDAGKAAKAPAASKAEPEVTLLDRAAPAPGEHARRSLAAGTAGPSTPGPGGPATPGPGGPATGGPGGPPATGASGFDSNQWNSAVGLGGGAGGAYAGRARGGEASAESYAAAAESGFLTVDASPLSTFAADVDTASWSNARRMLESGQLPPAAAVRVEEFVNAFRYGGAEPSGNEPFAVESEVGACPWQPGNWLLRFSVRTRSIDASKVPPCNLVFLIDVSGSMNRPEKLPLLKQAMGLLIDQLRPQDNVAIVTYANGVHVPLEAATGADKQRIHDALAALRSGGGTNGAGGLQLAYEIADRHRTAGVNRVLLCTDGDFNVGIQKREELEAFVTEKKEKGIFLTVLGFGTGNLKDDRLETIADKGNGVYAYVDRIAEARRVLVEQFGATMMTVAKDVKLQVEFDPAFVKGYRQIGYDNRRLAAQDFRDDKKDGGELGAGHAVTALYEVLPRENAPATGEIATLRIRYKPPEGAASRETVQVLPLPAQVAERPSGDFWLAATAAAFAMQLKASEHRGALDFDRVAAMAEDLDRKQADQAELAQCIEKARSLQQPAGQPVEAKATATGGDR